MRNVHAPVTVGTTPRATPTTELVDLAAVMDSPDFPVQSVRTDVNDTY